MKSPIKNPLWPSGILLIVFGLCHVPLFLIGQTGWEGSVSWRKPILFGVSTGMTLCSIGWLFDCLNRNRIDRAIACVVSVSLMVEVLLIAIQQWRGKASHFNQATNLDAGIDQAMLILISIAFGGICYFAFRSFNEIDSLEDYRLAMRSGMLFLIVSCVVGFVISFYGYLQAKLGLSPELVGERGVPKFPHGIAIHSLQLFPGLVFVTRQLGLDLKQRLSLVWAAIISSLLLLGYAVFQTWSGYGRFEMDSSFSVMLFWASIVTFIVPALKIAFSTFSIWKA